MCLLFHLRQLRPVGLFSNDLPTAKWSMMRYRILSPQEDHDGKEEEQA
jgi:hypothetical protein